MPPKVIGFKASVGYGWQAGQFVLTLDGAGYAGIVPQLPTSDRI